jgi:hypothetical protein
MAVQPIARRYTDWVIAVHSQKWVTQFKFVGICNLKITHNLNTTFMRTHTGKQWSVLCYYLVRTIWSAEEERTLFSLDMSTRSDTLAMRHTQEIDSCRILMQCDHVSLCGVKLDSPVLGY